MVCGISKKIKVFGILFGILHNLHYLCIVNIEERNNMNTIMSMDSIYEMLSSLTDTNKKWLADHLYKDISKNKVVKTKSESLSDEELAARLSQFPSWDEVDHADLSSINYSNYKPFESPKTKEVISKWL